MAKAKDLVIVESPAKAKTIEKYLGSGYKVTASMGHLRDLPKSKMGVDIEHGFEPQYIPVRDKKELISELKKEYYIPYAVDCLVKSGQARTEVLSTPSHWFGVTYKEDRPAVVAKFKELADTGVYPSPLYK